MSTSKDSEYGRTPLWCAATNGHEAVVKLLLDSGKVDVDVVDTRYDRTPLWCAITNGHEAVVKLLLDSCKVDADAKDGNDQMLMLYAAAYKDKAIVNLLLDGGKVDVDAEESEYGSDVADVGDPEAA